MDAAIIRSIPGFGPANAASLCTDMPELGSINRRIQGGREHPRNLLYMAATSAIRFKPQMQAFFERLRDSGQQHKVAMAAVMRKLITLGNAMHPRRPRMAACTPGSARPSHDLRHSLPHSRQRASRGLRPVTTSVPSSTAKVAREPFPAGNPLDK